MCNGGIVVKCVIASTLYMHVYLCYLYKDAVSISNSDRDPFAIVNNDETEDGSDNHPEEQLSTFMVLDEQSASLPLTQENLNLHDSLANTTSAIITNKSTVPGNIMCMIYDLYTFLFIYIVELPLSRNNTELEVMEEDSIVLLSEAG